MDLNVFWISDKFTVRIERKFRNMLMSAYKSNKIIKKHRVIRGTYTKMTFLLGPAGSVVLSLFAEPGIKKRTGFSPRFSFYYQLEGVI